MVSRRCVFFIGGYDPKTPMAFFERMKREMLRFEATWGVAARCEIAQKSANAGCMTVVTAKPDGWEVTTQFHFFGLDSIVMKDAARPLPVRFFGYLLAFLDYWVSGTAFSFFTTSWRFALYFLYPFVAAALLFLAVVLACAVAMSYARVSVPALPVLIGLLALLPLLATVGKRWSVIHLMDLWTFSRDYLKGRRPDAEALLEEYASMVAETVSAEQFDEIVFVGHSTGGGLILDVAARALAANPALTASGAEVGVLTLGSTALKFGLHPAAAAFRRRVQTLVDDPRVGWWEFQCLVDVINFYKSNPVEAMRLRPRGQDGAAVVPTVVKIRIRDMLDDDLYKRMRANVFRIHYQFILANTKRYYYDFFLICFGPRPLSAGFDELRGSSIADTQA